MARIGLVRELVGKGRDLRVKAAEALLYDADGNVFIRPDAPGYDSGRGTIAVFDIGGSSQVDLHADAAAHLKGVRQARPSELQSLRRVRKIMLFRPNITIFRYTADGTMYSTLNKLDRSDGGEWYMSADGLKLDERTGIVTGAARDAVIQSKPMKGLVAVRALSKTAKRLTGRRYGQEVKLGTGLSAWAVLA